MSGYLNSMKDLELLYYSNKGSKFIQKSDSPVLSTTTGVYNAVYGAQVWRQLNQADVAFGLLPKSAWNRSGWRVITARGDGTGSTGITSPSGGVAEGGNIPATTKPTFAEVSTKPKEVVHAFNVSTKQQYLSKISNDDAVGDLDFQRTYWGIEHKEQIDAMLLADVDTTTTNNFESIDRVCSGYDEVDASLIDSGDPDIYGLDRSSSATWADAYVNENAGTDRALSDSLIRATLANTSANGGRSTLWLTGHDQYANIQGLYQDQARYNHPMKEGVSTDSVNGIETALGTEVGFNVSTVYGIPIFRDSHVVKDTGSRVYLLDTSNPEGFDYGRLQIRMANPTAYYETPDFFAINKLAHEGMYMTSGELICSYFGAQGKIRDLL